MTNTDEKKSVADRLLNAFLSQDHKLFHNEQGSFVAVGKFCEVVRVKSERLSQHLRMLYYQEFKRTVSGDAVSEVKSMLDAMALAGKHEAVYHKVAAFDNAIYFDLVDAEWRVVEVRSGRWKVIQCPPVRFIRDPRMLPLPLPTHPATGAGKFIDALAPLVNATSDDLLLIVAWLFGCLSPVKPYPVLVLKGEQGTSKSTIAKLLKQLLDPNMGDARAQPKSIEDVFIAARNNHVVVFDNLSSISQWLSDALCGLSTEMGMGKRELYTNGEEFIMKAAKPVIVNGIDDLATRGDLLSRSVVIELQPIEPDKRIAEKELWSRFNEARPLLLGMLFDALAFKLTDAEAEPLPSDNPRMIDFLNFVWGGASQLGFSPTAFYAAYQNNINSHVSIVLDSSVVMQTIIDWLDDKGMAAYNGTAGELLTSINQFWYETKRESKPRNWPKDAARFGSYLRRIAPALRSIGWTVGFEHTGNVRTLTLRKPAEVDRQGEPNGVNGHE